MAAAAIDLDASYSRIWSTSDPVAEMRARAAEWTRKADLLERQLRTCNAIVDAFCQCWPIERGRLLSKARTNRVAFARAVLMYLLREAEFAPSYPIIGLVMHRDHTSVMHGHELIAARMAKQPEFAVFIRGLAAEIGHQGKAETDRHGVSGLVTALPVTSGGNGA